MFFGRFKWNSSSISNVLILCLYMIITTTTVVAAPSFMGVVTTTSNGFVPEDQWVCGATPWDKSLAYQRANESCRDVGFDINHCCAVHDTCYMQDKSQAECDVPFCACLAQQAMKSADRGCTAAMEEFCWIVKLLGGFAHSNSKSSKADIAVSSSTIMPLPTTSEKTTERSKPTEAECFLPGIGYCVIEFETCQATNHFEVLQCEEKMCLCTRGALRPNADSECQEHINNACRILDTVAIKSAQEEDNLFSTQITIFGFTTTLLTASILLVVALLPLGFASWQFYRYINRRHSMPISPSQTPLCAASSDDSGLCISNDTISSGVKLSLYP